MDDDTVTCEICMEKYDNGSHIPKQVPCCNKVFCITCLNDVFKRNNNIILCPICRTTIQSTPNSLPTADSVFADFISCLSCNKQIIKSEINISLDSKNFTCINCANNDMALADFLEYIKGDLNDFAKEYSTNEITDVKQVLHTQISNKINALFGPLIENLTNKLVFTIMKEIEIKFKYDIDNDLIKYTSYIDELKKVNESVNSFVKEVDKKMDLQQLQGNIKYYMNNFDNIKNERIKYDNVNNLIKEGKLFQVKMGIRDIEEFFMNVFKIDLNHEQTDCGSYTVTDFFDNTSTPFKEKIDELERDKKYLEMEIQRILMNIEKTSSKGNKSKYKHYTKEGNNEGQRMALSMNLVMNDEQKQTNITKSDSSPYNFGFYANNKIRIIDIYED